MGSIVGAETTCPDSFRGMVFDEIERVRSRGVEPKDFERLRRTLFGRFITLFDSFDTVGQVQMRLSDTGEDLFSYGSLLKARPGYCNVRTGLPGQGESRYYGYC